MLKGISWNEWKWCQTPNNYNRLRVFDVSIYRNLVNELMRTREKKIEGKKLKKKYYIHTQTPFANESFQSSKNINWYAFFFHSVWLFNVSQQHKQISLAMTGLEEKRKERRKKNWDGKEWADCLEHDRHDFWLSSNCRRKHASEWLIYLWWLTTTKLGTGGSRKWPLLSLYYEKEN